MPDDNPMLINKSSIKDVIKNAGCRSSADSMGVLDTIARNMIKTTCDLAKDYNRKTIMPRDVEPFRMRTVMPKKTTNLKKKLVKEYIKGDALPGCSASSDDAIKMLSVALEDVAIKACNIADANGDKTVTGKTLNPFL